MQYATVSAYDGSLPTMVMSVPCSVVTMRGTGRPLSAMMLRARYAAAACGIA